jgi:hypothetical protein
MFFDAPTCEPCITASETIGIGTLSGPTTGAGKLRFRECDLHLGRACRAGRLKGGRIVQLEHKLNIQCVALKSPLLPDCYLCLTEKGESS